MARWINSKFAHTTHLILWLDTQDVSSNESWGQCVFTWSTGLTGCIIEKGNFVQEKREVSQTRIRIDVTSYKMANNDLSNVKCENVWENNLLTPPDFLPCYKSCIDNEAS